MPQYQGVWTLQQQMQALTSGQWATDPLFDYTTLLLQGDAGANGAQNNVFYDTSPNQFAITRNGNTTQGSFTPFSATGWSNYFDGSGDYLTSTVSSVGSSGDLTVEGWVYPTASGVRRTFFFIGSTGTFDLNLFSEITTGNVLRFLIRNDSVVDILDISSTTTVSTNTWSHVAFVLSGTSATIYLNGTSVATGTLSGTRTGTFTTGSIGALLSGGATHYFNGYISNLRYVKGTAVYTSNFTPSPTPLTAITNTSLLTCQSNRFVDNSTNAYAITRNGDTSVQPFSPFAPQYQWTSDVIGGSGYFDGTSDYLTSSTSTTLDLNGSIDFTIEAWVYLTGYGAISNDLTYRIAGKFTPTGGAGYMFGLIGSTGLPSFYGAGGAVSVSATNAVKLNTWTHIAVVKNGSTYTHYLNGVANGSGTPGSPSLNASTDAFSIGFYTGTAYSEAFKGYMCDVRVVKGTAVYTSGFTPPTAPLTAVTNTQLLCNFTNAGIYDGTMKNNLETVADAKISTSVVKYGSGSMYFDGSGDWLTTPLSPWMNLGTSDFTMECWVYFTSVSSTQMFFSSNYNAGTGAGGWAFLYRQDNTTIKFTCNSNVSYEKTWVPVVGTWYHVAVSRANSNLRIFVNGVQLGTTSTSTDNIASASTLYVGSNVATQLPLFGYMDDARITVGVARYTQNFIPPSVALPRQ